MRLYNVEFFNRAFEYVGSQQISSFVYEEDYLSPSTNTIELLSDTNVEVGNIISIKSYTSNEEYSGLVTAITTEKTKKIKFKPWISLLDVNTEIGTYTTVEGWIKNAISNTFINNPDDYQNIQGLTIKSTSNTSGSLGLPDDDVIANILDVCIEVLKRYGIAVNFTLDLGAKAINVTVGKVVALDKVIEADLPNIIDKNIVIKNSDSSVNKETIINISENGNNEKVTYYRDANGTITTAPTTRVVPVVFDFTTINAKSSEFAEKALERAESDLTPPKYNNLIEITIKDDDDLINPAQYKIGQTVNIMCNDTVYNTIYTGITQKDGTCVLMFGAIRLELTKILKRRLK